MTKRLVSSLDSKAQVDTSCLSWIWARRGFDLGSCHHGLPVNLLPKNIWKQSQQLEYNNFGKGAFRRAHQYRLFWFPYHIMRGSVYLMVYLISHPILSVQTQRLLVCLRWKGPRLLPPEIPHNWKKNYYIYKVLPNYYILLWLNGETLHTMT